MIKNFDQSVKEGFILVDFHAKWCGPCRMLMPIIDSLDIPNLNILKVDVDENSDLAIRFSVMTVPTLMLFKDGKLMSTMNGFIPKEQLETWINQNM